MTMMRKTLILLLFVAGQGALAQQTYSFTVGEASGTFEVRFLISADWRTGTGRIYERPLGNEYYVDASMYKNIVVIARISNLTLSTNPTGSVVLTAPYSSLSTLGTLSKTKLPPGFSKKTGKITLESGVTTSGNLYYTVDEEELVRNNDNKITLSVDVRQGTERRTVKVSSPYFPVVPVKKTSLGDDFGKTAPPQPLDQQRDGGSMTSAEVKPINDSRKPDFPPIKKNDPEPMAASPENTQPGTEVKDDPDRFDFDANDCSALKQNLARYRDTRKIGELLDLMHRNCPLPQLNYRNTGDNEYEIQIGDRVELQPRSVIELVLPPGVTEVKRRPDFTLPATLVTVRIDGARETRIRVKDRFGGEATLTINTGVPALEAAAKDEGAKIGISGIRGGKGAYFIDIYRNRNFQESISIGAQKAFAVEKSRLSDGTYQLYLSDTRRSENKLLIEFVNEKKAEGIWDEASRAVTICGILALLGVGGFLLFRRSVDKPGGRRRYS